ncbi:MAG: efflux RND transporter periplasmic adaptor subunit [Flavobacteriales bacterium]|nr:efflux RND transporter periplasmic adaptor subunit [Flavobacteriales bacterium]
MKPFFHNHKTIYFHLNRMSIYILFVLFSAGCSGGQKDHENDPGHDHDLIHEETESNKTTLTQEQIKSIGIELGTIEQKQLTASLKANGLLRVPNHNRANATAYHGGIIQTLKVQTGNVVSKGQILATISHMEIIEMQENFLSVSAELELAESEYERQKKLNEGNAGSLKNLQKALAELKSLRAKKTGLTKQLQLLGINSLNLNAQNMQSYINIISPISGTISQLNVNIGSNVEANQSIAEIVDNHQLHLDLYVYEKDLNKVKEGQTIHFTLTNDPGKEYDADIYSISNTFEKNSKAISVHALVKGDKTGLIDGMSITALVSLEQNTVDAVPVEAIVNHDGQDYIFIVSGEESSQTLKEEIAKNEKKPGSNNSAENSSTYTYEKIPVKKGTTDIGYSEVTLLKELPANSKVVVKGAFFILAKMNNKGEGHHDH